MGGGMPRSARRYFLRGWRCATLRLLLETHWGLSVTKRRDCTAGSLLERVHKRLLRTKATLDQDLRIRLQGLFDARGLVCTDDGIAWKATALVSYLAARMALTVKPVRLGRLLNQVFLGGADVNDLLLACIRHSKELLKVERPAIACKCGCAFLYLSADMARRLE